MFTLDILHSIFFPSWYFCPHHRPGRFSSHIFCLETRHFFLFFLCGDKLLENSPQQSHYGIVGFQKAAGEDCSLVTKVCDYISQDC